MHICASPCYFITEPVIHLFDLIYSPFLPLRTLSFIGFIDDLRKKNNEAQQVQLTFTQTALTIQHKYYRLNKMFKILELEARPN